MGETANLLASSLPHGWDDGFNVKSICGCRLIFGSVPLSDLGMITHGFGKKALMDVDLADLIGATFVIGMSADLEKLRKLDLPVSAKRHRDYLAARELGLNAAAMWLRVCERTVPVDCRVKEKQMGCIVCSRESPPGLNQPNFRSTP
jgi:hypothetical protein